MDVPTFPDKAYGDECLKQRKDQYEALVAHTSEAIKELNTYPLTLLPVKSETFGERFLIVIQVDTAKYVPIGFLIEAEEFKGDITKVYSDVPYTLVSAECGGLKGLAKQSGLAVEP